MKSKSIKPQSSIATILAINEATHYLVGTEDNNGHFIPLFCFDTVITCDSIEAAKQLLKKHAIYRAKLTMQSAYDEMCGLPSSSQTSEIITF